MNKFLLFSNWWLELHVWDGASSCYSLSRISPLIRGKEKSITRWELIAIVYVFIR